MLNPETSFHVANAPTLAMRWKHTRSALRRRLNRSAWRAGTACATILLGACQAAVNATPASAASPAQILVANPRGISDSALVGLAAKPAPGTQMSYAPEPSQIQDSLFQAIVRHGGGFIRLATNPLPLLSDDAPTRAAAIAQIVQLVDRVNANGLNVFVDIQHWTPGDPGRQTADLVSQASGRAQLSRGLTELARELNKRPAGRVGLELLNEPSCHLMPTIDWPAVEGGLYDDVRRVAPILPVALTGCSGNGDDMMKIDASRYRNDPNAIFTFHFYEPFIFTHQQTYFYGVRLTSVPFPPAASKYPLLMALAAEVPPDVAVTKPQAVHDLTVYLRSAQDENYIASRLHEFGLWADRNGIARSRIYMGEFGMNIAHPNDDGNAIYPDALRWWHAVASSAQREGFAYSLWGLPRPQAYVTDPATGFLRTDLMQAIGWKP